MPLNPSLCQALTTNTYRAARHRLCRGVFANLFFFAVFVIFDVVGHTFQPIEPAERESRRGPKGLYLPAVGWECELFRFVWFVFWPGG